MEFRLSVFRRSLVRVVCDVKQAELTAPSGEAGQIIANFLAARDVFDRCGARCPLWYRRQYCN
jgi:hypothetical protein